MTVTYFIPPWIYYPYVFSQVIIASFLLWAGITYFWRNR